MNKIQTSIDSKIDPSISTQDNLSTTDVVRTNSTSDKSLPHRVSKASPDDSQLLNNWRDISSRVTTACQQANRAIEDVSLIAVSKTKPVAMIASLAEQGQQHFGENYLQESLDKIQHMSKIMPHTPISWHYIGHIQRNKTKDIAEHFSWVHTIERDIIAKRLSSQRPPDLPPLNVLIQVNIDEEPSKSGCHPDELATLVSSIKEYPNIRLRGLMVIPTKIIENNGNGQGMDHEDSSKTGNHAFARTKALFDQIANSYSQLDQWDTLSMGMSSDLEMAVARGATMVRVGTAIFGSRSS